MTRQEEVRLLKRLVRKMQGGNGCGGGGQLNEWSDGFENGKYVCRAIIRKEIKKIKEKL